MLSKLAAFLWLFLLAAPLLAEPLVAAPLPPDDGQGRIALATNANDDSAPVSAELGQATHFIVYDNQGKYLETLTPPGGESGNFKAVLELLAEHQITALVVENFDDTVLELALEHDIIPLNKKGPVKDAVISLLQCEPNPPLEDAGSAVEIESP
jgi:predicted Fe-Mo cluster-binding NifX family protein